MKLTVFIVALDVVEESTEASRQGCFQLHPAHRGAHPLSGLVGADFIVLSLPHTGAQWGWQLVIIEQFKKIQDFVYKIPRNCEKDNPIFSSNVCYNKNMTHLATNLENWSCVKKIAVWKFHTANITQWFPKLIKAYFHYNRTEKICQMLKLRKYKTFKKNIGSFWIWWLQHVSRWCWWC